jgi:hypothetical protein
LTFRRNPLPQARRKESAPSDIISIDQQSS